MTENLFTNVEINDGTVVLYFGKEHLKCSDEGLKALLNDMNNDIQHLKQALLFYIDVATCETSSNFDKDMEKTCQTIFGCSYDDANKKYGEYEFESEILQDFQQ